MSKSVKPFPLRQADDGKWEVEMRAGKWVKCETKGDAEILSNAPKKLVELDKSMLPNEALGAKFEKTAENLEQYKMRPGARYFRAMAKRSRGNQNGRK